MPKTGGHIMKKALKVCGYVMAGICLFYAIIMGVMAGSGGGVGFGSFFGFIIFLAAGAYSLVIFFSFAKHFENQEDAIHLLSEISRKLDRGGSSGYLSNGSGTNSGEETWICPQCGCPNSKSMRSCKSCGHCL